jgi:hypothetical protein
MENVETKPTTYNILMNDVEMSFNINKISFDVIANSFEEALGTLFLEGRDLNHLYYITNSQTGIMLIRNNNTNELVITTRETHVNNLLSLLNKKKTIN